MKSMLRLLALGLVFGAVGCASNDDDVAADDSNFTSAPACQAVDATVEKTASKTGTKVSTAMTKCIAGNASELMDRLTKLAMDDATFGKAEAFDKYKPSKVEGDIASADGAVRSVEIEFKVKGIDPSTTLKLTVKKEPAKVTFHAVNTKKFAPRVAGLALDTIVPENGLDLELTAVPSGDGVSVTGKFSADVDNKYLKQFEKPDAVARFLAYWIEKKVTSE